jgi:3-dehydro-L-gulonate 2-dehydrogenase
MRHMKRIPFDEIRQELARVLLAVGFEDSAAKRCARIFTENTGDGVASHGLNRFPTFVTDVKMGLVKTRVEPERVNSFGALEQWDGKRGVGILNAEKW